MCRHSSTFESGAPGAGLLLLRLTAAVTLIALGLRLHDGAPPQAVASHAVAGVAGVLLLAGLWTPVAGLIVAVTEMWIASSHGQDLWTSIVLAGLGAALALLGPGRWSADARIYGWKRIQIRRPAE